VRECLKNNVKIECLPGPTAFVPALVKSGLPCDTFVFEGFLPQKKGRQTALLKLKEQEKTMIFYESPFRLLKSLENFKEYLGAERQASVSRELTKIYEETVNGTIEELITYFSSKTVKGEIVMVVAGKETKKSKAEKEEQEEED
jgi:16S rRNA (cytidine1402-2'-O)-methyltransferase